MRDPKLAHILVWYAIKEQPVYPSSELCIFKPSFLLSGGVSMFGGVDIVSALRAKSKFHGKQIRCCILMNPSLHIISSAFN